MKKSITYLICLFSFTMIVAQAQSLPCQSQPYKGFDFWLGDWSVTDTLGNKLGENTIQKVEQGCLVTEYWRSEGGGSGRSMNYFDPSDSTWNQLWVSSNGFILKMKGAASKNQMTLTSDLSTSQSGSSVYHRITWTLNEDQTVTQLWEVLGENRQVISEAFKGIYAKK